MLLIISQIISTCCGRRASMNGVECCYKMPKIIVIRMSFVVMTLHHFHCVYIFCCCYHCRYISNYFHPFFLFFFIFWVFFFSVSLTNSFEKSCLVFLIIFFFLFFSPRFFILLPIFHVEIFVVVLCID